MDNGSVQIIEDDFGLIYHEECCSFILKFRSNFAVISFLSL